MRRGWPAGGRTGSLAGWLAGRLAGTQACAPHLAALPSPGCGIAGWALCRYGLGPAVGDWNVNGSWEDLWAW